MGYRLKELMKVWCRRNVERGGSFADEFKSGRRLGIEVSVEVLGEDVEEVYDAVGHGLPDSAVLDENGVHSRSGLW